LNQGASRMRSGVLAGKEVKNSGRPNQGGGTMNIFCIRPSTRNIGNDLIGMAIDLIVRDTIRADINFINVPALKGAQFGGLTSKQVHDINRIGDGVIIGGGNLFENGQLTVDGQALAALRVPMAIIGVSHGRIYDRAGVEFVDRTDAMPPAVIRQLVEKACVTLVRDGASRDALTKMGLAGVKLGGCPTMCLPAPNPKPVSDGSILVSIRHPGRMSVPPHYQWRVFDDLRRMLIALEAKYGRKAKLVCHDYNDLEFASAFAGVPFIYFDNVFKYVEALQQCEISVTYRLHAFLPCLAFGIPSVNISYDGRCKAMMTTAGMSSWDIDMFGAGDLVDTVMARCAQVDEYYRLRGSVQAGHAKLKDVLVGGISEFGERVRSHNVSRG